MRVLNSNGVTIAQLTECSSGNEQPRYYDGGPVAFYFRFFFVFLTFMVGSSDFKIGLVSAY